jgi:hypothetical protein
MVGQDNTAKQNLTVAKFHGKHFRSKDVSWNSSSLYIHGTTQARTFDYPRRSWGQPLANRRFVRPS